MSMSQDEIVNWEEAMTQCGDDEEFLRELLADLRQEIDTQVGKIALTIQVCVGKKNIGTCHNN